MQSKLRLRVFSISLIIEGIQEFKPEYLTGFYQYADGVMADFVNSPQK